MFLVTKSFYLMHRDLVVFTGELLEGEVGPGMLVDLLAELGGPGPVAIHSVEPVRFADGTESMAITVPWDAISPVPLFEPSTLEGKKLPITG
jgi:hypothetical protein